MKKLLEKIKAKRAEKKQSAKKEASDKPRMKKWARWTIVILLWLGALMPFIMLKIMLGVADDGNLPGFQDLENPQSNLASVIYTEDGVEMGQYFLENRQNVRYDQLSPYLVNALISTEDERFHEHSGVDIRALSRVVYGVASGNTSQGGGSTITQQLAKMLFPREKLDTWGLINRKFQEWIIAARLEKSYTKEEIIAMYFNKFDFLNNAVGIKSAARVYFNTTPDSLKLHEAAMLVGMAKNPSLFNPLRFEDTVTHRREVVLYQMKKNGFISKEEYDSVRTMPLGLDYTKVDHQEGLAPYFREVLRKELENLLATKNIDGSYVYHKPDGEPYDIYKDGLRIYTTINSRMQKYAEWAVKEHLGKELQADFDKNNLKWKRPPFSNDLNEEQIESLLNTAKLRSQRYKIYAGKQCSNCQRPEKYIEKVKIDGKDFYRCLGCKAEREVPTASEIEKGFSTPIEMRVFDWKSPNYEKDTVMSPNDSIRYYKGFLRAGLLSMDPHTGFIKAWVGGPDFRHFKLDHVYRTYRQVGSTFKPLVYAVAMRDRIYAEGPCKSFPDLEYCHDIEYVPGKFKSWCPSNSGASYTGEPIELKFALAASMNNITSRIMKDISPKDVVKLAEDMGVRKGVLDPVVSICLGVFDLSVYEMIGIMGTFANKGIYTKPIFITRIEDKNGNVIMDIQPETKEALDEGTAYTMLTMMKGTTSGLVHPTIRKNGRALYGGTAVRIRGSHHPYAKIKHPIAGKTGTTQNQSDGWFMGLTPDLVTGVWVGAEDRAVRFRSLQLGMGTNMALPIWGYYMNKVYADPSIDISTGDFDPPEGPPQYEFDCTPFREPRDVFEAEGDVFGDGYYGGEW